MIPNTPVHHIIGSIIPSEVEQRLRKSMPAKAFAEFQKNMKEGNVTLDINVADGSSLCPTIISSLGNKANTEICK